MNKNYLTILFLLFFLINSFASGSELTLQINESNQIQATHVYDDDGSIGFVDVTIINNGSETEYSFTNIVENQTLLGINEGEEAYYNFMDDDGEVKGIGYLLPVNGVPEPGPPAPPSITVIQNASITPIVYDEENAKFKLVIQADLNEEHSINSVEWFYSIKDAEQNQTINLTGDSKTFTGELKELTGEKIITSKIRVIDSIGEEYNFDLGTKTFNLMSINPYCNYSTTPDVTGDGKFTCLDVDCLWNYVMGLELDPDCKKISHYSQAIEDGVITAGDVQQMYALACPNGSCSEGECIVNGDLEKKDNEKIFFSTIGDSKLQLKFTDETKSSVYASYVYDDDDSIALVKVIYDNGSGVTEKEFNNVIQGQVLTGLNIPTGADSEYYYSDFDGGVEGQGANEEILDSDSASFCELNPNHPSCLPAPNLIKTAKITSYLNQQQLKYYLDFEVTPETGQELDWVKIEYDSDKSYSKTITLNKSGDKFVGSIGPFDSEAFTYARARAGSGEYTDTEYLNPRWDYLLIGLTPCEEICGDEIDNDADGFIDEGCGILPQLHPRITNLPKFVLIEKKFNLNYLVENSGGMDANSFKIKSYWIGEKRRDEDINSLKRNEEKQYSNELYSGEKPGKKQFKFEIDYLNQISESNETDNVLTANIWVRLNQFDVNYNYNNTFFLGDIREIKLRDLFKQNIQNAECEIIYPSGRTIDLNSDEKGVIRFTLLEGGTHILKARKKNFENFEGDFKIEAINVGYKKELETGDVQLIQLKTKNGKPVENATITIISPSGKTVKVKTNKQGQAFFVVQEKGTHAFIIKRKDVSFYNSKFESLTLTEQVSLVMNQFFEVTAGKTILDWILFLILLTLSIYAGIKTFNKLKTRIKPGLSSREIKQKLVLNSIISGIVFTTPIVVKILIGITAAIIIALIEIMLILIIKYVEKQELKNKKIRVE